MMIILSALSQKLLMDESALKISLYNLDTCWSLLEHWLWFCAGVVFVGVALEVIPAVWQYLLEKFDFERGVIHSPERPSRLKFSLEVVGSILIAVGVFGELVVGIKMAKVESRMRDDTAKLVSLVDQRAKDAGERAAKADLARVQLEKSMMLRHLSEKQGEALCSAIPKKFLLQVSVTSSSQDWEAFRYALDFNQALQKCVLAAGLQPSGIGVGGSFWGQNVTFGVWIRFPKHETLDDPKSKELICNPNRRKALAEKVRKILEAAGVEIAGVSDQGRGLIDIYVGPRQLPGTTGITTSMPSRAIIF
jgi:hypothetical protein